MAKQFAPRFDDRPPSPPQPDLRDNEDGNGDDDIVAMMEIDGHPFPQWLRVTPELMEQLSDD